MTSASTSTFPQLTSTSNLCQSVESVDKLSSSTLTLTLTFPADELPRPDVNSEAVDFRAASEFLSGRGRSAGAPAPVWHPSRSPILPRQPSACPLSFA